MEEIWKTVVINGVEYPRYMVSSLGRVKSLNYRNTGVEKIMTPTKNQDGYLDVNIKGLRKVHRLVAEAFIPNPDGFQEVDHINCNRSDNRLVNIRFTTHKENCNNPISRKNYSECRKGERHPLFGKHQTEETKKKISNARIGKYCGEKAPMYGKFGADNPNSIPIVQLTLDGQFIKKWSCAAEAGRELVIPNQSITLCCKKRPRYHTAGGYRWMYYDDWLKLQRKKPQDIKPLF